MVDPLHDSPLHQQTISPQDVDEVWLALDQAEAFLGRESHRPDPNILNCMGCYTMYLIRQAKEAYRKRPLVREQCPEEIGLLNGSIDHLRVKLEAAEQENRRLRTENEARTKLLAVARYRADRVEQERDEFQAIFDMQWAREVEVWQRWREEGKILPLTLPDYGHVIEMLTMELAEAKQERDRWKNAVLDAGVVHWVLSEANSHEPDELIRAIIRQVVAENLDPAVSKQAAEVDRLEGELRVAREKAALADEMQDFLDQGLDAWRTRYDALKGSDANKRR